MEPYKIKSVESIHFTTKAYRKNVLLKAYLNLFLIPSKDVIIDLLTDSGTGAMSADQWSVLMRGDESYAGSTGFYELEKTVQDITGMPFVIPVHQGRSGERILLHALRSKGEYIISNTLFDTTRANSQDYKFKILDLPCESLKEDFKYHDFKGNIDLNKLEENLKEKSVAGIIITVTNNSGGGQPVSIENLKAVKQLSQKYKTPFILDACRFAENVWFIKCREKEFQSHSPKKIARLLFDMADMCFVSAKKDGLSNIGGFIALRDENLTEECKNRLILTEGFPTYGGLAGRDLASVAVGLREVLEESYLHHRISSTQYLYDLLKKEDVPVLNPPGGHAVYICAKTALPHIPVSAYPAQAFVSGLYEYAGIRACEIGSVMFGKTLENGKKLYYGKELVRLCLPRRVYTQSHLEWTAQSIAGFLKKDAPHIKGVKFEKEPSVLRHFTAHFTWL